jgi:F0F1-type ATP synthase assembly protein I
MTEQENSKAPQTQASKKRPYKAYAKFSGMAFQMGLTIALGVWGGMKLDALWGTDPWLTVGLSLLSVFAAMYFILRGLG